MSRRRRACGESCLSASDKELLRALTLEALDRANDICDWNSVGTCTDEKAWAPAMHAANELFVVMIKFGIFTPKDSIEAAQINVHLQRSNRTRLRSLINKRVLCKRNKEDKAHPYPYDLYFSTILKMVRETFKTAQERTHVH